MRSIVSGASATSPASTSPSQVVACPFPAPAVAPTTAGTGRAAFITTSSAAGTVICFPHFLQRPCLPAIRGSTVNFEPQLWQKNTMLIGPDPLSWAMGADV